MILESWPPISITVWASAWNRQAAMARNGLERLPRSFRLRLTLSWTAAPRPLPFSCWAGFLEYSYHGATGVTLSIRNVTRSDTQGLNGGIVVYHHLAFPWSARFDFYGLSSLNNPRYWQVVYAPSLARVINTTALRMTLVGWDRSSPGTW
jgi:hypothetical protein